MVAKIEKDTVPPDLVLTVGSKRLEKFMAISIKCHYQINGIPWAELILSTPDNQFELHEDELKLCLPGNDFSITTKTGNTLFSGIVVQTIRNTNVVRSELLLQIKHPLQKLMGSPHNEVYEQQSDANIIRKLCNTQGIKLNKISGLDILHPQMVQLRSSDWHFMLTRLKANGVWLIPTADSLTLAVPELKVKAEHSINWPSKNGSDIFISNASWRSNILNLTKTLEATGWSPQEQKIKTARAKTQALGSGAFDVAKLNTLTKESWTTCKSIPYESGELEALATGKLQMMQNNAISGRYELSGSTAYQVGDTVSLNGFGKSFDGTAIITEVEQFMIQGSWKTTIGVGLQDPWGGAEITSLPAVSSNHIGVIESFQKDPEGLERFKVRIPSLFQNNKSIWARLGTPYAGKGHGIYLYPEVGDEVIVSFFDNDPRYPVIIGSMFNSKNPPAYPANQDGQRTIVFDKDKKQQVVFDSKNGSLTLESGDDSLVMQKGITFASSKDVIVQSENLNVSSKKSVSIKANSSVDIKGPKIQMDQ